MPWQRGYPPEVLDQLTDDEERYYPEPPLPNYPQWRCPPPHPTFQRPRFADEKCLHFISEPDWQQAQLKAGIEQITFRVDFPLRDYHLRALARVSKNIRLGLRSLDLGELPYSGKGPWRVSNSAITALVKAYPRLEHVRICNIPTLSDKVIADILFGCPNLKSLELWPGDRVDVPVTFRAEAFEQMFIHDLCMNLEFLKLVNCETESWIYDYFECLSGERKKGLKRPSLEIAYSINKGDGEETSLFWREGYSFHYPKNCDSDVETNDEDERNWLYRVEEDSETESSEEEQEDDEEDSVDEGEEEYEDDKADSEASSESYDFEAGYQKKMSMQPQPHPGPYEPPSYPEPSCLYIEHDNQFDPATLKPGIEKIIFGREVEANDLHLKVIANGPKDFCESLLIVEVKSEGAKRHGTCITERGVNAVATACPNLRGIATVNMVHRNKTGCVWRVE